MLLLNLKNYPNAVGPGNVDRYLQAVADYRGQNPDRGQNVLIAPPMYDLSYASKLIDPAAIVAPHVDAARMGSTTGWTPAEALLNMGVGYALLNHSEHRMWGMELITYIAAVQEMGLKLIICCENLEEAELLMDARPYAIAYEDKELIGSGQSLTKANPKSVAEFIDLVNSVTIPMVGAGVTTVDDIKAGRDMGAQGFIISSAFVRAPDPLAKIEELATAWA
jgi:triosephosphate isomerase (TIM)